MADIVLFVFEGERTEPQILKNLKTHYFEEGINTVIHATFNTHIYTLWDKVVLCLHLNKEKQGCFVWR